MRKLTYQSWCPCDRVQRGAGIVGYQRDGICRGLADWLYLAVRKIRAL